MAEDAIWEGFAEGFGEGDVVGEENDVGGVGEGELGGPFGEFVVDERGAGVGVAVEEVFNYHDGAVFGVGFEVFVVTQFGVLVVSFAGFQGDVLQRGGGFGPDLYELVFEGF